MASKIKKKLLIVGFAVSMLYAIFMAMPLYINSSILNIYFKTSNVSIIYSVAALISFLFSILIAKHIKKIHSYNLTLLILFTSFVATLSLGIFENKTIVIASFILHFLGTAILFTLINLFVAEFTDSEQRGTTRGLFLTIINSGILLSPLLAGHISATYGYKYVYIVSSLMLIPIMFLIKHYYKNISDPIYENISMLAAINQIKRSKNISGIILSTFLLESFFTIMAIYAPLYLIANTNINLAEYVGQIIPFALIPFVLLPYGLGYLADKKFGEKEMLLIGFTILIGCSLFFPLLKTSNIFYVAAFLFVSRIGAVLIETMNHVYFYKKIEVERVAVITVFNNMRTISYVIVPFIASIIIYITGQMSYIFYIYAIIAALLIYRVCKIKDTL